MANPSLDEITKECCKVCGLYRCTNHSDWLKCETKGCMSTYDSKDFLGCPECLNKEGKPVYRPKMKETCYFCKSSLKDGSSAYTDGSPGGTFCLPCATFRKIAFWTITVRRGRLWTAEEVLAEHKRA